MEHERVQPRRAPEWPRVTRLPDPEQSLLFDEADVLHAGRTAVRDAHDRYAELETLEPPDDLTPTPAATGLEPDRAEPTGRPPVGRT